MTERIAKKLFLGVCLLLFIITLDKKNEAMASIKGISGIFRLSFHVEPQDVTAVPGSDVQLKCAASLARNNQVDYHWILNGSELVFPGQLAPGHVVYVPKHDGGLWIQNIGGAAYGVYQCVAKVSGRAIISKKASVRMPYLFQRSDYVPTNITCNEMRSCTIPPPHIISFPPPTLIWEFRKNRREDQFQVLGNSSQELVGRRDSRFVVSLEGVLCNVNVSKVDEGEYRCRAVNGYKTLVFPQIYHVYIKDASKEIPEDKSKGDILFKPKNITVGVTSTASFDCIVSGRNTAIKWWKGDAQNFINADKKYEIPVTGYRLNIKRSKKDDQDWYGCIVVNYVNVSVVKKAFLRVREPVLLGAAWNRRSIIYRQGDELALTKTAHYGELKWYKDGLPIDHDFLLSGKGVWHITRTTRKVGEEIVQDDQTLMFKNVQSEDSGIYQVWAEGFKSQVSDNITVIVYAPTKAPTTKLKPPLATVTTPRIPTRNTKVTGVVYGLTAAGVCLLFIFGICLLSYRRRTRKKTNKQDIEMEETTQTTDLEAPGYSPSKHIYATPDHSGNTNLTLENITNKQSATNAHDTHETPLYAILEAPYETVNNPVHPTSTNFDKNGTSSIYATINDGYNTNDCDMRPKIYETSFSEEVYTSLSELRALDTNIYASLCTPEKSGEVAAAAPEKPGEVAAASPEKLGEAIAADEIRKSYRDELASLPGIDSADLDYVFLC